MGITPTPSDAREELKTIFNDVYFNREHFEGFVARIDTLLAEKVREVEKAYGGCHNCYGKGYATKQSFVTGGGKKWQTSPMKFCDCERGKQLEAHLKGASK